MKRNVTIATRGSKLALIQSEIVKRLLIEKFPDLDVRLLEVITSGDVDQKTPLSAFGNSGVFVKGLEQKLINGEADIAVHSLKDVPTDFHPHLTLASFPVREDPRDVLIAKDNLHWRELKKGSVIGTSSPARKEQLKLLRPDLKFEDIRGNVETRVNKVLTGKYDATILAAAGLKRLGFRIDKKSYLTIDEIIPSPGQGALVIQANRENMEILQMVELLNNKEVQYQVESERTFMEVIGGGCRYPIAAHAELKGAEVVFRAIAQKPEFRKLKKIKTTISKNDLLKESEEIARNFIT